MPLTPFQLATVEHSIEHLIELPEEKSQLFDHVKILKNCLTEHFELKDPDHTKLQECFFESTRSFNNLESSNPTITIDEVQITIVKYITSCIEKAAQKNNIELTALGWNEISFIDLIKKGPQYQKSFVSTNRPKSEESHPYFLEPAGRRFSVHFIPEINPPIVTLNLIVKALHEIKASNVICLFDIFNKMPDVKGSNDDRVDSGRFSELIIKSAEVIAGRLLLNDLIQSKSIAAKHQWSCSLGALALLTYDNCYEVIKNKIISFDDVAHVHEDQVEFLVTLMQAGLIPTKLSIEKALSLKGSEKSLLLNSFYSQEVVAGRIPLSLIKGMTEDCVQRISHPNIINLLKLNKASFQAVRHLSLSACNLLDNEFYFDSAKRSFEYKKNRKNY
jgi:hypothetical protein